MASGFFAILDDVAALMDDVASTSKVATRKTAGILGDDLAVNAEKATGFLSSRELPVLWAIAKGSFINKLIIVPLALLLNAFFPIAIKVALILGGLFLAYEGMEKIVEYLFHRAKPNYELKSEDDNSIEAEKKKVKSAITTDFILSVEIVIIALGSVLDKSLAMQIIIVSIVSILATVGVYGLVALIVRMDDAGYKLIRRSGNKGVFFILGKMLVKSLPLVIKALAVIGTIALILVAGGIFIHNIEYIHHHLPQLPETINEFLVGAVAGLVAVAILSAVKKVVSLVKRR